MKNFKYIIGFIFGMLCIATQCRRDDCITSINFINNSSKEVYINLTGISHHYSNLDTTKFCLMFNNPYNNPYQLQVKPYQEKSTVFDYDCLESWIPEGRTFLFVFDGEVLSTVQWDTICKYYMVLKTYHITMEDMKNNNWTITYSED